MKGIGRHYNLNHFGMSTTVVRRESCSAKRSLASRRGTPRESRGKGLWERSERVWRRSGRALGAPGPHSLTTVTGNYFTIHAILENKSNSK